jgi:hypothetical protein
MREVNEHKIGNMSANVFEIKCFEVENINFNHNNLENMMENEAALCRLSKTFIFTFTLTEINYVLKYRVINSIRVPPKVGDQHHEHVHSFVCGSQALHEHLEFIVIHPRPEEIPKSYMSRSEVTKVSKVTSQEVKNRAMTLLWKSKHSESCSAC